MKTIGILGGMGPEASIQVYQHLIRQSYAYAAENMENYPHILINNIPKPNIFQRFNKETGIYLGEQARVLETAGAKAIGVACNSAHHYWSYIRAAVSPNVWLVDMIDEVAKRVEKDGFRLIGILSSNMSRQLYVKAASDHQFEIIPLADSEQNQLERIISRILAGERTAALKAELQALSDEQMKRRAQCVILGCTDLPIILSRTDVTYPLYTSNYILAESLFQFAISE